MMTTASPYHTSKRAAVEDDDAWFEAHPARRFRLRPYVRGEFLSTGGFPPAPLTLVMIVPEVGRLRLPIYAGPIDEKLAEDDDFLETEWLAFGHTVRKLADRSARGHALKFAEAKRARRAEKRAKENPANTP